jgi:hypothetical protein
MKIQFLSVLLFLPLLPAAAQHAIIPTPVQYESTSAIFTLDSRVSLDIRTDHPEVRKYATQFQEFLKRAGIRLELQMVDLENPQHRAIVINFCPTGRRNWVKRAIFWRLKKGSSISRPMNPPEFLTDYRPYGNCFRQPSKILLHHHRLR